MVQKKRHPLFFLMSVQRIPQDGMVPGRQMRPDLVSGPLADDRPDQGQIRSGVIPEGDDPGLPQRVRRTVQDPGFFAPCDIQGVFDGKRPGNQAPDHGQVGLFGQAPVLSASRKRSAAFSSKATATMPEVGLSSLPRRIAGRPGNNSERWSSRQAPPPGPIDAVDRPPGLTTAP